MSSTASQVLGDAYVNVLAETGKLETGFAKARQMTQDLVTNLGKTLAVGIGAAIAGAVGTGVAGVWAWAKEEQSVADLTSSIKMLGGSLEELMPRYEKVAAQIQQNTTIADSATRSAMAYAASLGAPVDRLDELAVAAVGLAGRLKMGVQGAMMLLVRSMRSGRFDLFSRYGLQLDKNMTAQEKLAEVMKYANAGFQKQIELANTLSGRLIQLKNNLGDWMESLGETIAERFQLKEIVDEFSKRIYRMVQSFDSVVSKMQPAKIDLTAIGDRFEDIVKKMVAFVMTLPEVGRQIKEWFNWENLKSTASAVWDSLKMIGRFLSDSIVSAFRSVFPIFEGLSIVISEALTKALYTALNNVTIFGVPMLPKYEGTPIPTEEIMGIAARRSKGEWGRAMEEIERRWKETMETLKQDSSNLFGEEADAIKEKYDKAFKWVSDIFGSFKTTADVPEFEKKPWDTGGMGDKQGTVFSSFSDWWKRMQQSAGQNRLEKLADEQKGLLGKIVINTEQLVNNSSESRGVFA